jgi:hypothetical protein
VDPGLFILKYGEVLKEYFPIRFVPGYHAYDASWRAKRCRDWVHIFNSCTDKTLKIFQDNLEVLEHLSISDPNKNLIQDLNHRKIQELKTLDFDYDPKNLDTNINYFLKASEIVSVTFKSNDYQKGKSYWIPIFNIEADTIYFEVSPESSTRHTMKDLEASIIQGRKYCRKFILKVDLTFLTHLSCIISLENLLKNASENFQECHLIINLPNFNMGYEALNIFSVILYRIPNKVKTTFVYENFKWLGKTPKDKSYTISDLDKALRQFKGLQDRGNIHNIYSESVLWLDTHDKELYSQTYWDMWNRTLKEPEGGVTLGVLVEEYEKQIESLRDHDDDL